MFHVKHRRGVSPAFRLTKNVFYDSVILAVKLIIRR